jgi:T5orf172 domain
MATAGKMSTTGVGYRSQIGKRRQPERENCLFWAHLVVHALTTRAGHCVQCDPKKIAYVLRFSSSAYVYIAGSSSGLIVKIGTAINVPQREHQLRAERYGGYGDWTVVFNVMVEEAGRIEYNARTRLGRYQISRPYWKDGVQQRAEELLQCSFSVALEAVTWAIGEKKMSDLWQSSNCWTYDFE